MKTVVGAISAAVRRSPIAVVLVTVVVSMALGGLSQQFQPGNDNEAFAPDAPELLAAERISDLFGAETAQSVLQVVVESDAADVVTLDGLATVDAVRRAILTGSLADRLVEQPGQGAVISYLAPVELALAEGAPPPTSDAEVKALFAQSLTELPAEQRGAVTGLLPATADAEALTAPSGLIIAFVQGAASDDEFEEVAAIFSDAAREIRSTELPPGYDAEPFSFELLFSDTDEFEAEIGRLFATAGFIILLVLALVFMVLPDSSTNRLIAGLGVVAMVGAVVILVLPSLAKSFPGVLPETVGDWSTSGLLAGGAATFALVFVVWAVSTGRLRRTVADTLVTIIGIFFAIGIMNGLGYLLFEDASPMAQVLPILLIGLGVDYSIHLNSRYREELASGATVEASISGAVRTVGVALILATITTAVGFLTNLTSDIPALSEFGALAAIGIGASFVIMMTFVPAVRLLLDRRAERKDRLDRASLRTGEARFLPRLIGRTAWLAKHAPIPTVIVALLLGVVGAFGVTQLEAKFSFLDFVPTTSPLRSTFETILEDYGGGFGETTQVLVEGDVASPATWNGMVASTANMADTTNVLVFEGVPQAQSPVSLVAQKVTAESPGFDESVAAVAAEIGLGEGLAVPDGADVGALYDAVSTADPEGASGVLHRSSDGYDAALVTVGTQAGEEGASRLRTDLADDFQPVADASVVVTSDEIISDVVVTSLRDSQVSSLLYTLAAVLVLLVANFWFEVRRPLLGVITTLPVVLVVLTAFGLMAALGIAFGPITATVAALAVGIGIPYMIHITHRYEEDRLTRESEDDAIESTLTHTGGALAGSALTTVAGFGILVTSTTIPFRQFGLVTAYTILLSLLAAILVLPSLLVLWDHYHRRRGAEPIDTSAFVATYGDVVSVERGGDGERAPGAIDQPGEAAPEGVPRP